MAGKNIVDSNGTITYVGASEITKGNHNNMPSRTDAYLETDERGHIQASSLGGSNKTDNVVPQSADLNHGAYYSMEHGERSALNHGAEIQSEKTAYVSNQPGGRPDAFIVNDTVSYADGQTQNVHLSFSNLTSEEQNEMNMEATEKTSDSHPVTLQMLFSLADVQLELRNFKHSLELFETLYAFYESIFGEEHKNTLIVKKKISLIRKIMYETH